MLRSSAHGFGRVNSFKALVGGALAIILLFAGCNSNLPTSAGTSLPPATVIVPTALALTLLTPQSTTPIPEPCWPLRIEHARSGLAAAVTKLTYVDGQMAFPQFSAGYVEQSAPLGAGGNTILVGVETPAVFGALRSLQPDDVLLVTDQLALTRPYRVVEAGPVEEVEWRSPSRNAEGESLTLYGISPTGSFFRVRTVPAR